MLSKNRFGEQRVFETQNLIEIFQGPSLNIDPIAMNRKKKKQISVFVYQISTNSKETIAVSFRGPFFLQENAIEADQNESTPLLRS